MSQPLNQLNPSSLTSAKIIPLTPKKILILEDDESLKPVFNTIFETIDARILPDWVSSVEDALVRLKKEEEASPSIPYDMIIADIFLNGEGTGIDFLKVCQEKYPKMYVLIMSSAPLVKLLKLLGPSTACPVFLEKPIRIPECLGIFKRILLHSDS